MRTVLLLSSGAVMLWLSGCVQPQQLDMIEREQRRMRGEIRSETGNIQSELQSIRSNLADTRASLQQIQREFSALKERIEETRYQVGRQIGQTSREGDQRIKELENRVAKLDEALKAQDASLKSQEALVESRQLEIKQLRETVAAQAAASAAEAAAAAASMPAEPVNDSAAAETPAVRRDYEVGWRALEKKDYKVAISQFKDFLKKHPKSRLADNAQYWIGECHYALREFDQAIVEFDAVRRRYPQGDKVPAAVLKQGFAFAELGEKVNARLVLQELVEKYPQSPEASKAKTRLKALES